MTSTHITSNPLLADGWHHGHHWIVCLVVLVVLAAAVAAFIRRRGTTKRPDGGDLPRRILGERFARGEINADEYRERLSQLQ